MLDVKSIVISYIACTLANIYAAIGLRPHKNIKGTHIAIECEGVAY